MRINTIELALPRLEQAKWISERNERPPVSWSWYGVVRQELGLDFETDLITRSESIGDNFHLIFILALLVVKYMLLLECIRSNIRQKQVHCT